MVIRPFREVGRPPCQPSHRSNHCRTRCSTNLMVKTTRAQSRTIAMGEREATRGITSTATPSVARQTIAPIQHRACLAFPAYGLLGMIQAPGEVGLQILNSHTIPIRQPSQVLIAPQFWQFGLLAPWAGG